MDGEREIAIRQHSEIFDEMPDRPGRDNPVRHGGERRILMLGGRMRHEARNVRCDGRPVFHVWSLHNPRRLVKSNAAQYSLEMASSYPPLPPRAPWNIARVHYPAGDYQHPPTGLFQVRLIRRGSSHAEIDLGAGLRRVFTRPGDLLISLPDAPTTFRIQEGRELTLLQIEPDRASALVKQAGGGALADLRPLSQRPLREPLVAELLRRLEADELGSAEARDWALGVVLAIFVGGARQMILARRPTALSNVKLRQLLDEIGRDLSANWSVEKLAERAGLPRRIFAAAFKEGTGLPVRQYLLRRRVDEAAKLLRDGKLSIAEIAAVTGFANQAHLTRVTSRLLHTSPKRIREGGKP
jgi:AraC family transcriptional regulator